MPLVQLSPSPLVCRLLRAVLDGAPDSMLLCVLQAIVDAVASSTVVCGVLSERVVADVASVAAVAALGCLFLGFDCHRWLLAVLSILVSGPMLFI